MPALSSNQLIRITARLGLARLAVSRLGGIVQRADDMKSTGEYKWTREYPDAGTWTTDKR